MITIAFFIWIVIINLYQIKFLKSFVMDFQGIRGDWSSHPRPGENVLGQRALRYDPLFPSFLLSFPYSFILPFLPSSLSYFFPSCIPLFCLLHVLTPSITLTLALTLPPSLSLLYSYSLTHSHPQSLFLSYCPLPHTLAPTHPFSPLLPSYRLPGITLEGSCQGVYRSASFLSTLIFNTQYIIVYVNFIHYIIYLFTLHIHVIDISYNFKFNVFHLSSYIHFVHFFITSLCFFSFGCRALDLIFEAYTENDIASQSHYHNNNSNNNSNNSNNSNNNNNMIANKQSQLNATVSTCGVQERTCCTVLSHSILLISTLPSLDCLSLYFSCHRFLIFDTFYSFFRPFKTVILQLLKWRVRKLARIGQYQRGRRRGGWRKL